MANSRHFPLVFREDANAKKAVVEDKPGTFYRLSLGAIDSLKTVFYDELVTVLYMFDEEKIKQRKLREQILVDTL